jgi:hypothetical protein
MELLSFIGIFEKDIHNNITKSWVFPSFPPGCDQVLVDRAQLKGETQDEFVYSRFAGLWNYTFVYDVDNKLYTDDASRMLRFSSKILFALGSKVFIYLFKLCLFGLDILP